MLKLELQYFGHLMQRTNSFEKTLMLGKIEGRRRGRQRIRWLDGITELMNMNEDSEKVGLKLTFIKLRSWYLVPSLHGI